MRCILFGHKDAPEAVCTPLAKMISYLAREYGVCDFLVGNNGNYDYFAQCALRDVFQNGEKIRYSIVLSHLFERALSGEQKATVFPEGLECVPPKFAISKRNLWLVKNAEYAIVYVENKISNCGKLLQKALARGIQIINIADFDMKNEDWAIL